ncbi:hypothetical protein OUZ56_012010 [Daphnia magna]|uniref:Uncharacterized protein n=1 Tax=Daphnia magna TaxID=35525 RepID=A0ABQ9Z1T2_9CRUS|nr:hypothetical protein OUZ56_012010 [Daphnia magna]
MQRGQWREKNARRRGSSQDISRGTIGRWGEEGKFREVEENSNNPCVEEESGAGRHAIASEIFIVEWCHLQGGKGECFYRVRMGAGYGYRFRANPCGSCGTRRLIKAEKYNV